MAYPVARDRGGGCLPHREGEDRNRAAAVHWSLIGERYRTNGRQVAGVYLAKRNDLLLQAAVEPCPGQRGAGPGQRVGRWIAQRGISSRQPRGGGRQVLSVAHCSSSTASSSR